MNKSMAIWCLVFVLLPAGLAAAQALADPTRPPADLLLLSQQSPGAIPAGPALVAIVLSAERKYAVIDGKVVPLGARHGNARLVQLTPSEATLAEGKERTVLRLLPAIERTAPGARADAGRKSR